MKTLTPEAAELIKKELESLPEKYAKSNFNSTHEAYAVILEEVRELEDEVFFGAKKAKSLFGNPPSSLVAADLVHKDRMREECVQIAAMCVRFIQELTPKG